MNCIGGSFHVDFVMQHGGMCGNFDIIMTHHFGPFLAYPQPFTAPHTPCGVLYLGAMRRAFVGADLPQNCPCAVAPLMSMLVGC